MHTKCVKCGKPKEQGDECPHCGVYYLKAEAAQAKKNESQLKVKEKAILHQRLEDEKRQEESDSEIETQGNDPSKEKAPKTLSFAVLAVLAVFLLGFIYEAFDVDAPFSSKSSSSSASSNSGSSYKRTASTTSTPISKPSYAEAVVALLNTSYGNVCHAELNGFFNRTLKIDWTGNTKVLHSMKVLAEIGSVKEGLYNDGVRYFQFPNDAGTYNVIDWKSGQKTSNSDRANYYFRNR